MLTHDRDDSGLIRVETSVVNQATGVLVLVHRTPPHAALQLLHEAANRHAVGLTELADAVVAVASGGTPRDPMFGHLIDYEWGDLLF